MCVRERECLCVCVCERERDFFFVSVCVEGGRCVVEHCPHLRRVCVSDSRRQNLSLTVLYVPYSLESKRGSVQSERNPALPRRVYLTERIYQLVLECLPPYKTVSLIRQLVIVNNVLTTLRES